MKPLHSIDVLNLSDYDLKAALAQHNISLTIDEAKTISRDILNGRGQYHLTSDGCTYTLTAFKWYGFFIIYRANAQRHSCEHICYW